MDALVTTLGPADNRFVKVKAAIPAEHFKIFIAKLTRTATKSQVTYLEYLCSEDGQIVGF